MHMRNILQRNTGLCLMIMSHCCFSSINVAMKKLNGLDPPIPTMQLILVLMGPTALFSLLWMIIAGVKDPLLGPKDVRPLLLLRGSSGFVSLAGLYLSLHSLSVSDATVLTFLVPICTVFAGAFFLGESFSRRQVFAGCVSLVGVILIARPTSLFNVQVDTFALVNGNPTKNVAPTDRLIAVGLALFGVMGATISYTTLRAIGNRAHAMHSMVYFSITCVLCSTISMIAARDSIVVPTRAWLVPLILIGIFGFLAQLLLTVGFQCETAGRGSMAMYTQIIFATILERMFFHTHPTPYSVTGIILISGSALYIAVSKVNSDESVKGSESIRLPDEEEALLSRYTPDRYVM